MAHARKPARKAKLGRVKDGSAEAGTAKIAPPKARLH